MIEVGTIVTGGANYWSFDGTTLENNTTGNISLTAPLVGSINSSVGNGTTGTFHLQNSSAHRIVKFTAGVNDLDVIFDADGVTIKKATDVIFSFKTNGEVWVKEVIAGTPNALTGELLELFDSGGVSRGFIPIYTKL